jgi:NitT/TauT family transport system permease protein
MSTYSKEHLLFLKKRKRKKLIIIISQLTLLIGIILFWQISSDLDLINNFLFSSPKKVIKLIIELRKIDLLEHIKITTYETIISFLIASIIGLAIATLLWLNDTLAKILDPYLTVINSLPKVALGPLIIIWVGASTKSIIVMALMISLIISIINIYNSFTNTDENYITLLKSMKATKWQIYKKIILPGNKQNIINTLKINISMSLIGVIMGELLVSKKGLGYLIMYGSQVFNITLTIASITILAFLSYILYYIINKIEKILIKN